MPALKDISPSPATHRGGATRQKSEFNVGRSAKNWSSRSQLALHICPECGSQKTWKDGLRYTRHGQVQRWLCRRCGFRFSKSTAQPKVKIDVSGEILKQSHSQADHADRLSGRRDLSFEKRLDHLSLVSCEDIASHNPSQSTIVEKPLNKSFPYNRGCRVCVSDGEMKNLAKVEPLKSRLAGATKKDQETIKGKIIEFAWWMRKQGYKEAYYKNKTYMLRRLVNLGANLYDPESIKELLAKRDLAKEFPSVEKEWGEGYKANICNGYSLFLKMEGLKWEKPRYKISQKRAFIPTETELNQLIAACGKVVGTFLQGLKDTGADPGELGAARWIDVDVEKKVLAINFPVKGHDSRVLRVSEEFIARLNRLPRKRERIFSYVGLRSNFEGQRRRIAAKLGNPRIMKIHFTTFRHWKGTMEYHKTKDILHVKKLLGHKNIKNTLIYIDYEKIAFGPEVDDEFTVKVASNVNEDKELIEAGFQYVTDRDGLKIYRRRK